MANIYQTAAQTCHVKSDNYAAAISSRLYDHLVKGSLGDCLLSAEGKFIRAHKLILSISSEYFENMFSVNGMDKPVVIMPLGLKFTDLCLILDFAYLGQAQVPHDGLDEFLKAGELLQIRGIKERRLNFMTAQPQQSTNRSFDSTISSTQETFAQPQTKRPREDDDDISIQEASEIMKMLFENNLEIDTEVQDVTTETSMIPPPVPTFLSRPPMMQGQPISFLPVAPVPPTPSKKKAIGIGKKNQDKEKFPCRFCKRSMASKGRASKHENECNENPNREIAICDICHIEVKPSTMTQHKNNKHGMKNHATSPDYMNQHSTSPPVNSPPPMTVTEPMPMNSPDDPQTTTTPPQTPLDTKFIGFSPAMSMQVLKVEKVDIKSEEISPETKEILQ